MHVNTRNSANTMQGGANRTQTQTGRLRRFVFTLNNWTQKEFDDICQLNCKWLIVGKEKGTNGTPHLQGACVIGRQVAFSTIKKWPGFHRCWIQRMRGTPEDSLRYCTKQDREAFQSGMMPQPGKRNDLKDTIQEMKDGKTLAEIVKGEDIGVISAVVKYHRGLNYIASLMRPNREHPPVVFWIYGSTGVGKTRSAVEFGHDLGGPYGMWISSGSLRWFDGYMGQPIVLFDDLRTKHAEFSFLLRLLDRYPLQVEIKGGYVNWVPRIILITAPKDPEAMWSLRTDEDKQQLCRRVSCHIPADDHGDYAAIKEVLYDEYDAYCATFKIPKMLGDALNVETIEVKEEPKWPERNPEILKTTIVIEDSLSTTEEYDYEESLSGSLPCNSSQSSG